MRRGSSVRSAPTLALLSALAVSASACGLVGDDVDRGEGTPEPPREEPGPTLAEGPPPADWKDVHSPTGLVYSVPPDWEIGDQFGQTDPSAPGTGRPDGTQGSDGGSDWGSGFLTTANAIADPGYCPLSGFSFRTLSGISGVLPGDSRDQVESASRAMADSIDRRFTENGADAPAPRPEKIGVSGAPAWHLSLRGRVRPPRNTCTPPVIRFDTVAVSTRTPEGAPATIVFVLMADEGEQGVQPEETIDRVVASLRYDISV